MIRLALIGGEHASRYEEVARRLEGVEVVPIDDVKARGGEVMLDPACASCDAVLIHADPERRAALATAATTARKHVLVESPLAPTAAEAERVVQAANEAGVHLMVGQLRRFHPAVATIKSRITAGQLGSLGLLRIHRWTPRGAAASPPPQRVLPEIDICQWLFEALPTAIHASCREFHDGAYLQLHFGFPAGGMALVDHAATLPAGAGYFSLSAIGSSGAAYADDHHNTHLVFNGGEPRALVSEQEGGSLLDQTREFIAAIAGNRSPSVTGAEGRAALQTAEAVRDCLALKRPVRRLGGRYESVD